MFKERELFGGDIYPDSGTRAWYLTSYAAKQYLPVQTTDITDWAADESRLRALVSPAPTAYYTVPSYYGKEIFSSTERYYKENQCSHQRSRFLNYRFRTGYYSSNGFNWITNLHHTYRLPTAGLTPQAVPGMKWNSVVTDQLRSEVYYTMRPRLEGGVNLLNSIFELKDFRDFYRYLTPDRILGAMNRARRIAKRTPLFTDISRKAASGILAKHLALDPMLADIGRIIAELQHLVFTKQRDMELYGQLGSRSHFVREFDPVQVVHASNNYIDMMYRRVTRSKTVFRAHATMFYRYAPRHAINAMMTFWGINPTASAIWSCIPFSFLYDYIFSIGKSLKLMGVDSNVTHFRLEDYTESLLIIAQNGYIVHGGYQSAPTLSPAGVLVLNQMGEYYNPTVQEWPLVSGYDATNYRRILTYPYFGPALPQFRIPSSKQGLNMLALLRCFI